jgi:two-component system LytT family response regulator
MRVVRVVIVEDEPLAATLLQESLEALRPGISVLATCSSVADAQAFLADLSLPPDLLFLDIELDDGTAFDLLESLADPPPCIFCTAYDQYYRDAFRTNGIAYILKPFVPEEIEAALAKVEHLRKTFATQEGEIRPRLFLVRQSDHTLPVASERVAAFLWEEATLFLETADGERYPYGRTLDTVERETSPQHFFRIARNALVQRNAVRKCHLRSDRRLEVELPTGSRLLVSRSRVRSFQAWLANP